MWAILAGSGIGLLATMMGRLYASAFYALKDTGSPLRYAVLRVLLSTVLGSILALLLPPLLGLDPRWGVAGLTVSTGFCGWLEYILLRNGINRRIDKTGLRARFLWQLWGAAGAAAAAAWGLKFLTGISHPIGLAIVTLGAYGLVYFIVTSAFHMPEATDVMNRVARMAGLPRSGRSA